MPLFKRVFHSFHLTGLILGFLLRLRYRIRLQGVEQIRECETPILFLFEHPARHDSFFHFAALSQLKSKRSRRPLLAAYVAEGDVVMDPRVQRLCSSRWINLPKIFPSPRASDPGERKREATELIAGVITHLKSGHHLALSPSGMLIRSDGHTLIKEKYGTFSILKAFNPGELTIVATKFDGLFGSVWSRALTGELPSGALVKKVLCSFLKGGLLLSVRRRVTVTFEACTLPMGEAATLSTVNRAIEGIFSQRKTGSHIPYNRIDKKTLRELNLELSTSEFYKRSAPPL